MKPEGKLNTELLTPEELSMPIGLGYEAAADRLGLIYLADTVEMALLLSRFAEQAMQLSADRNAGFLNAVQFDKALDELIDRLAEILCGENPRYMAIPWFTDPDQLRQSILDDVSPDCADVPEYLARLTADPVREQVLIFLTTAIESDLFDYVELNEFITNQTQGMLGIPGQVPLPFDVRFTPSRSISVVRRAPAATDAEIDPAES